jgi:hypothetical protein
VFAPVSPADLDAILALQLSVAWAGERAGDPARLGWWSSDLVDPLGGGDLFGRLVPRTAPWAALHLVRKVAQHVDAEARSKLAIGDTVWTLFHFGFDVDEALAERLAHHRANGIAPAEVLRDALAIGPWSSDAFAARLAKLGSPKTEATSGGLRLKHAVGSAPEAAPLLAAALAPLPPHYPMPYLERSSG